MNRSTAVVNNVRDIKVLAAGGVTILFVLTATVVDAWAMVGLGAVFAALAALVPVPSLYRSMLVVVAVAGILNLVGGFLLVLAGA